MIFISDYSLFVLTPVWYVVLVCVHSAHRSHSASVPVLPKLPSLSPSLLCTQGNRYSVFPRERERCFSSPSLSPCFPEDKLQPLQTQSSRPHFAILPPWHPLCGCSLSPQTSPAATPLGTGDAQSGGTPPKEATVTLTTYDAAPRLPLYVHGLLHRVRALPRSRPEVPAWLPPLSSSLRPCFGLGSFSPLLLHPHWRFLPFKPTLLCPPQGMVSPGLPSSWTHPCSQLTSLLNCPQPCF